jgi:hypothetical protein
LVVIGKVCKTSMRYARNGVMNIRVIMVAGKSLSKVVRKKKYKK